MNQKILSKMISVLVLAALTVWIWRLHYLKWENLGKEAYVAHWSAAYDKIYAHHIPLMHFCIISLVCCAILFCIYEAVALGVFKLVNAGNKRNE
jgi:hypothetical protein